MLVDDLLEYLKECMALPDGDFLVGINHAYDKMSEKWRKSQQGLPTPLEFRGAMCQAMDLYLDEIKGKQE